jgi:hypothetical protein
LVGVGAQYFAWSYNMNAAYDVDPLISTTAMAGFDEWASFYRKYKVLHFQIQAQFTNYEAFPVTIIGVPNDYNLVGVITSKAKAWNIGEQPMSSRPLILSAAGGQDRGTFVANVSLPRFTGNPRSYMDDVSYGAYNNMNPVTVLSYVFVGISETNFSAGVQMNLRVKMRVLWTQVNYIIEPALRLKPPAGHELVSLDLQSVSETPVLESETIATNAVSVSKLVALTLN